MNDLTDEERVISLGYADFPKDADVATRNAWIAERATGKLKRSDPISIDWVPERMFDDAQFLESISRTYNNGELGRLKAVALVKLAPYWAANRANLDVAFLTCPKALQKMLRVVGSQDLYRYGSSGQKQLLGEISKNMHERGIVVTIPAKFYARLLIAVRYSLAYPGPEHAYNVSPEDHDAKMRELLATNFFDSEQDAAYKNVNLLVEPTVEELYSLLDFAIAHKNNFPPMSQSQALRNAHFRNLFLIAATRGRKHKNFGILATRCLRAVSHYCSGFVTENILRALGGLTETALAEVLPKIFHEEATEAIYLLHVVRPSMTGEYTLCPDAVEVPAEVFAALVDIAAADNEVKHYQVGVPPVDPNWLIENKHLFKTKRRAMRLITRSRPVVRYVE